MLPKEAIEEFKVLYKKHFGENLSDQEASGRANRLVDLYSAVYGSLAKKNFEDNSKDKEDANH